MDTVGSFLELGLRREINPYLWAPSNSLPWSLTAWMEQKT